MSVSAVNPEALDRIIRVCRHADLMASVVARWTLVRGDDGKFHEIAYRETLHYRAQKAARKILHVMHSFWLAYLGLCWGRWA